MKARHLITALLLATMAGAAAANTPAAAAEPVKAASAADAEANRKICRQEKPVGSQIPKRICKTAAEWEEDREQARKMMQDLQQRTGSTSGR